jgi:hypothetical protein
LCRLFPPQPLLLAENSPSLSIAFSSFIISRLVCPASLKQKKKSTSSAAHSFSHQTCVSELSASHVYPRCVRSLALSSSRLPLPTASCSML